MKSPKKKAESQLPESPTHIPEMPHVDTPAEARWWRNAKVMLPLWIVIGVLVTLGIHYEVNARVIAGSVLLVGVLSNAFAWLAGLVMLVPVIGPLIVKVLSIGFIWLLNAVGYLVAFVAIRRGYSKDVLTYRGLTVALIVGIVIGYILAQWL
ncbi:MAG: hypothetical protein ACYC4K_00380 [Thiobacillus sp.]